MTIAVICTGCNRIVPRSPCPACRSRADRERHQRRKQDPHQKVVLSHAWGKVRALVRARDGGCVRAGKDCYGALQVHHRVPVRFGGGAYDPSNLETVCRIHHEQAERDARRQYGTAPRP